MLVLDMETKTTEILDMLSRTKSPKKVAGTRCDGKRYYSVRPTMMVAE